MKIQCLDLHDWVYRSSATWFRSCHYKWCHVTFTFAMTMPFVRTWIYTDLSPLHKGNHVKQKLNKCVTCVCVYILFLQNPKTTLLYNLFSRAFSNSSRSHTGQITHSVESTLKISFASFALWALSRQGPGVTYFCFSSIKNGIWEQCVLRKMLFVWHA